MRATNPVQSLSMATNRRLVVPQCISHVRDPQSTQDYLTFGRGWILARVGAACHRRGRLHAHATNDATDPAPVTTSASLPGYVVFCDAQLLPRTNAMWQAVLPRPRPSPSRGPRLRRARSPHRCRPTRRRMAAAGLKPRRGGAASSIRGGGGRRWAMVLMAVALVLLSCGQPAVSEALSSFLEGIGLTDIEAPLAGVSYH